MLSVCIPTFNRRELIEPLVDSLLVDPDVEVCIHDDGSSDGTGEFLASLAADRPRLRVSGATNAGRASALVHASRLATGRFVMPYDDDDLVSGPGLATVLEYCRAGVPEGVCGFVFKMDDASGRPIGRPFPSKRSNFLKIRADEGVAGDHKQVILRSLWLDALRRASIEARRIPTSLYWSTLALDHDVLCDNASVGVKNYRAGGLTSTIRQVKAANLPPMIKLHDVIVRGFLTRRYRSALYALRSVFAAVYFRALALRGRLR